MALNVVDDIAPPTERLLLGLHGSEALTAAPSCDRWWRTPPGSDPAPWWPLIMAGWRGRRSARQCRQEEPRLPPLPADTADTADTADAPTIRFPPYRPRP